MRMAIIDIGGTVENIIEADPSFDPGPGGQLISADSFVDIGWRWDGKIFNAALAAPKNVTCVSDLQFRRALSQLGLREKTETLVAKGSQDLKDFWDRALEIDRNSPMVVEAARALGQSDAQLDQLFEIASTL